MQHYEEAEWKVFFNFKIRFKKKKYNTKKEYKNTKKNTIPNFKNNY